MRIESARLTAFRLPFREPIATAHGKLSTREGVLLELVADCGAVGCGEAMPLPGFGLEPLEESRRALVRLARGLLGRDPHRLDAALDGVERATPAAPAARAALDAALHDLAARALGVRVAELLIAGAPRRPRPRLAANALVSGETPQAAAREASRAVAAGFGTLKLKVGAGAIASDAERVRAVREEVGPRVALRLDANGAWSEETAGSALERLSGCGVEFLEQPIPPGDIGALARLRERSAVPIAADESVTGERAATALLEAGAADLLVLKPPVLGGLRAGRRIAERAHRARVGTVVTSLFDSAIGRAAALHLAAALPGPTPACGLATGSLLRCDLAPEPRAVGGEIALPLGAGLGVAPDPKALLRCATGPTAEILP